MKTTKFIMLLIVIALFQNNVKAQFSKIWNNTTLPKLHFLGAENMDADAEKEIVFYDEYSWKELYIIDGKTGLLKWQSSDEFTSVDGSNASIMDIEGNGKYEILFYGNKNGVWTYYLYGNNVVTNLKKNYETKIQSLNYPNPFSQTTTIKYTVSENGTNVNVKIFDGNGNEIKTLVNESKNIGEYEILFNGVELSNGVYYYQINFGKEKGTKKMIKME